MFSIMGFLKLQIGLWILLSNIRILGKKVSLRIKQKFFTIYLVLLLAHIVQLHKAPKSLQ